MIKALLMTLRKRQAPILGHGGVLVAGGTVIVGLAGQSGRVLPNADIVNHLAPLWLAAGLLGVVLGVLYKVRPRLCGILTVALAGLFINLIGPELIDHSPRSASISGQPLRVVQFNVWKDNPAPDAATRWILAQNADIVVLEEAARSGGRIRDALAARYPYQIDCLGAERRCSTVILSTKPPIDADGLARGDPENRGALSAVWARFDHPGGPFTVVGAHYMRPWPYSDQTRGQDQLIGFVNGEAQDRMILVGDFNATPWSFALKRQDKAWTLVRITRALPTWPNSEGLAGRLHLPPILPLDHVYIGRDLRKLSIRRGPRLGSDHYPVVIDLQALQHAP